MDLGVEQETHSFLVLPECPYPLLGCDLLTKMTAQIYFTNAGTHIKHPDGKTTGLFFTVPLEEEYRLHKQKSTPSPDMDTWLREFPTVWTEPGRMGLAKHQPPIHVELRLMQTL